MHEKVWHLVPVVTPCDSQGQVDTQGLISVCNEMTGLGCKGYLRFRQYRQRPLVRPGGPNQNLQGRCQREERIPQFS
ncbi:MAG: hypothetical protein ACLUNG_11780 [[Clostridium] leptum]